MHTLQKSRYLLALTSALKLITSWSVIVNIQLSDHVIGA